VWTLTTDRRTRIELWREVTKLDYLSERLSRRGRDACLVHIYPSGPDGWAAVPARREAARARPGETSTSAARPLRFAPAREDRDTPKVLRSRPARAPTGTFVNDRQLITVLLQDAITSASALHLPYLAGGNIGPNITRDLPPHEPRRPHADSQPALSDGVPRPQVCARNEHPAARAHARHRSLQDDHIRSGTCAATSC